MPTALQRITVDEYHQMIADGVLTEDDRVELLDGYLVEKMPHDPLHDGTIQLIVAALLRVLPAAWSCASSRRSHFPLANRNRTSP